MNLFQADKEGVSSRQAGLHSQPLAEGTRMSRDTG